MSALHLRAGLIVCVVLLVGCAADVEPSLVQTTSPEPSSVQTASPESSSFPSPGEPFTLGTHCGIGRMLIEFDGAFWEATGPGPLDDGSGNPPPGFGNPTDQGTIVRIDSERAVYRSSEGVFLTLKRLNQRPDVEPCF